jgi:hypothetical protein
MPLFKDKKKPEALLKHPEAQFLKDVLNRFATPEDIAKIKDPVFSVMVGQLGKLIVMLDSDGASAKVSQILDYICENWQTYKNTKVALHETYHD